MLLIYLIASAAAHMHLVSPAAKFEKDFISNPNTPASLCSLIDYYPGSNEILIPKFNKDLKAKYSSLREYADVCARATQGKTCGNTIPSAIVPMPTDGAIRIDIGPISNHIGPSEIWVDDKLVMYNPGMVQAALQKTPPTTRVDFSKVCPSGKCVVRFVMVALHNFPAEIFDNCVTMQGPVYNEVKTAITPKKSSKCLTRY
jgi:hypothetical protein